MPFPNKALERLYNAYCALYKSNKFHPSLFQPINDNTKQWIDKQLQADGTFFFDAEALEKITRLYKLGLGHVDIDTINPDTFVLVLDRFDTFNKMIGRGVVLADILSMSAVDFEDAAHTAERFNTSF
jgi:hypothetical protein